MIKFEDMYGVILLGDIPSDSELETLKSLGVNTFWLMAYWAGSPPGTTNGLAVDRINKHGMNSIVYSSHIDTEESSPHVPCYLMSPDEPTWHGWSYEGIRDKLIREKAKTAKPVGLCEAHECVPGLFPALNDYAEWILTGAYPWQNGYWHQDYIDNAWNYMQNLIHVPIVAIAQTHLGIPIDKIVYQKDFWRSKGLGILWYCWDAIKGRLDVYEAIRITPYVPPPPVYTCPICGATFGSQAELDDHIETEHAPPGVTCPQCGSLLEITPGEKGGWGDWEGYTGNLLKNPGFNEAKGLLPGWIRQSGAVWAWETGHARSGSICFAGSGHDACIYQNIDVSGFSDEIANGALKVKAGGYGADINGYGGRFKIEAKFLGSDGSQDYTSGWKSNDSWTYYGCEKIVPTGTTRIRMLLWVDNIGQFAALDDASLQLNKRSFVEPEPEVDLVCPKCGEPVGTGYTVRLISEEPWPLYTKKSVVCSGCGAELELTVSSIAEENVTQSCPICGTSAD